jgi:VRR-NUC domain
MAYHTAAELTKMMIDYLKDRGNDVWRNNNLAVKGRTFIGRKGVPDIIGFSKKYGQFIACEVKAIGDRPSVYQMEFLTNLGMCGGIAMICQQVRDESIIVKIFNKDGESEDWQFTEGELRK